MAVIDHDDHFETVPGLPGPLPQGEHLLWQGSPSWWPLAYRTFRFGWLVVYFGLLAAWRAAVAVADGGGVLESLAAAGLVIIGGSFAFGLMIILAWAMARATTYSITNRRVVISHGVALPLSVNLPFGMIDGANLKTYSDGTGDLALQLDEKQRLAYLVLWPHARPWRLSRVEPMLRAVPGAVAIARILGDALTESQVPAQATSSSAETSGIGLQNAQA